MKIIIKFELEKDKETYISYLRKIALIKVLILPFEMIKRFCKKKGITLIVNFTTANINIESIINSVCSFYHLSREQLNDPTRERRIVQARQIGMAISKKKTGLSLHQIGAEFGKDHATVLWSLKQVNNYIQTDKKIRYEIEKINESLTI
jgi:chromosomal replication initiation ATPase DnaA